jgi:hypothetical protein
VSELARLLIQAEDGSGEGLWARRTVAPGIFHLDNFPSSDVDYTLGDLVMAANDAAGHLYITGLAERRFRGTYLRSEATEDTGPAGAPRSGSGCGTAAGVAGPCGLAPGDVTRR